MATKKVPMGEGMYKYAGGAWGYLKPLPGTVTTQEQANAKFCDNDADDPQAPPS